MSKKHSSANDQKYSYKNNSTDKTPNKIKYNSIEYTYLKYSFEYKNTDTEK